MLNYVNHDEFSFGMRKTTGYRAHSNTCTHVNLLDMQRIASHTQSECSWGFGLLADSMHALTVPSRGRVSVQRAA